MILSKLYPTRSGESVQGEVVDNHLDGEILITHLDGTYTQESVAAYNGPIRVSIYIDRDFVDHEEYMLLNSELLSGEEYKSRLQDLEWLRNRAQSLSEVYADQETHHGLLMGRFRPLCGSKVEAAILATIQTGYWPDWMVINSSTTENLKAHCAEVAMASTFGTSLFGGYYQFDED